MTNQSKVPKERKGPTELLEGASYLEGIVLEKENGPQPDPPPHPIFKIDQNSSTYISLSVRDIKTILYKGWSQWSH